MVRYMVVVALLAVVGRPVGVLAQTTAPAQQPDSSVDDTRARTLFQAATAQFDAEQYQDALALFQQAFELSGRPALLYNIGLSAERVGDQGTAIEAYDRYLREDPEVERRDEVQRRVKTLRARQAALQPIAVPSASDASVGSSPIPSDDRQPRWYKKWWVWTIVSVAVVGTAVGIGASQAGGGAQVADPVTSTSGIDVMTFRR